MTYGNYSSIYSYIEHLFFWKSLENARFKYLNEVNQSKSILIIGEGDGRLAYKIGKMNAESQIDVLDISQAMINTAAKRCESLSNIKFICTDLFQFSHKNQTYDLIISPFFLDNFKSEHVFEIIEIINKLLLKNGLWYNIDFYENWFLCFVVRLYYIRFSS